MPASRNSELARGIIGLCRSPEGRSTQELGDILDRNRNSVSVYMSDLTRTGILFKGGADKSFRFFTDPAAAQAYTQTVIAALVVQREESAKLKKERDAKRQRNKRAEARAQQGDKPAQKHKKVSLAARDSGLVIATKQQEIDRKRFHAQVNVIWPEGVKITIIPTGVDTRFMAFIEPGKGQISRDWMARRRQERRVNT